MPGSESYGKLFIIYERHLKKIQETKFWKLKLDQPNYLFVGEVWRRKQTGLMPNIICLPLFRMVEGCPISSCLLTCKPPSASGRLELGNSNWSLVRQTKSFQTATNRKSTEKTTTGKPCELSLLHPLRLIA